MERTSLEANQNELGASAGHQFTLPWNFAHHPIQRATCTIVGTEVCRHAIPGGLPGFASPVDLDGRLACTGSGRPSK